MAIDWIEFENHCTTIAGRKEARYHFQRGKDRQIEIRKQINRVTELSRKPHSELRNMIDATEVLVASVPDSGWDEWLKTLNAAMDYKGRTTKEETARLSQYKIAVCTQDARLYYELKTNKILRFEGRIGRFSEVTGMLGASLWRPLTDEPTAKHIAERTP